MGTASHRGILRLRRERRRLLLRAAQAVRIRCSPVGGFERVERQIAEQPRNVGARQRGGGFGPRLLAGRRGARPLFPANLRWEPASAAAALSTRPRDEQRFIVVIPLRRDFRQRQRPEGASSTPRVIARGSRLRRNRPAMRSRLRIDGAVCVAAAVAATATRSPGRAGGSGALANASMPRSRSFGRRGGSGARNRAAIGPSSLTGESALATARFRRRRRGVRTGGGRRRRRARIGRAGRQVLLGLGDRRGPGVGDLEPLLASRAARADQRLLAAALLGVVLAAAARRRTARRRSLRRRRSRSGSRRRATRFRPAPVRSRASACRRRE